jgi:hypothetical protein
MRFHDRGLSSPRTQEELGKVADAGSYVHALGMRFNAGHALNYHNVGSIAALPDRARAAHRTCDRVSGGVRGDAETPSRR